MNKLFVLLSLLFVPIGMFAQNDEWSSWNDNYQLADYHTLIRSERLYADSVEKSPEIAQYYCRLDKYRFTAVYTGKYRLIDENVKKSMKRVFKLFVGNPDQLDKTVIHEYLFDFNGELVWCPVQLVLESYFEDEISTNQKIMIYCLFLNEHGQDGEFYNTLLVSEFNSI